MPATAILRRWVPVPLRMAVARARRAVDDRRSGALSAMAGQCQPETSLACLPRLVRVRQPIRQTAFYEGKLANIRLGAARLDSVVLQPGQILSFWKLIGPPLASAGFEMGRAIRGDVLHGETGGGLCQLSGLAYELGLRAGLAVLERHPHSRDLYTEEDRFTPLGLDATVVWPWKDLRLRNGHGTPVCLRFSVGEDWIEGSVHGADIAVCELEIERTDSADHRRVLVTRWTQCGERQCLGSDSYSIDPH